MTASFFYPRLNRFLYVRLAIPADLDLKIVHPAFMCHLHIGDPGGRSRLAPTSKAGIVLSLAVLALEKRSVHSRPCFLYISLVRSPYRPGNAVLPGIAGEWYYYGISIRNNRLPAVSRCPVLCTGVWPASSIAVLLV